MPERPLIIYYQCLDRAVDASFATILDELKHVSVDKLVIDNFSDTRQIAVAIAGIKNANRLLLIVDSRIGEGTLHLTGLLNQIKTNGGQLLWVGSHTFSAMALRMVKGKNLKESTLLNEIQLWLSQS